MIVIIFFENMVIDAFLACLFNVHYLIFLSLVSASEMTYIVSSGALNSTHSLCLWFVNMHIFMNIFGNRSITHNRTTTATTTNTPDCGSLYDTWPGNEEERRGDLYRSSGEHHIAAPVSGCRERCMSRSAENPEQSGLI